MQLNFLVTALAALVPLILGFIWYNPKVFGTAWMKSADVTAEKVKSVNMPLLMILGYVFALMMALSLNFMVVHQYHIYSILINEPGFGDPNSSVGKMVADFMAKYGQNYRAFHGLVSGVLLTVPIIGNNALHEGRKFKYIAINAAYWIVSMMIMGGIISAYA